MSQRNKRIENRLPQQDAPGSAPSSENAERSAQQGGGGEPQRPAGSDTIPSYRAVKDQGGQPAAERPGDTIRFRAAGRVPARPPEKTLTRMAAMQARRAGRPGGGSRMEEMPRQEVRGRPRWGLFSFIAGFFGLIIRVVVVTAIIMGLTAWAGFEAVKMYINTPQVTVPNVRGMKIADAVEVLSKGGFSTIKERSELSGLVAPGEIIEQHPQPGASAKSGTTVRIIISSGRANFIVPDVVGETKDNAMNKIKGAQLDVGNVTYIDSSTTPKDSVISQNPEANKGLEQGVKVDLLISSGNKTN